MHTRYKKGIMGQEKLNIPCRKYLKYISEKNVNENFEKLQLNVNKVPSMKNNSMKSKIQFLLFIH